MAAVRWPFCSGHNAMAIVLGLLFDVRCVPATLKHGAWALQGKVLLNDRLPLVQWFSTIPTL